MYSFEKGQKALNPYLAGAITGVLSVVSVFLTGKFFGASTTFARLGAAVYGVVAPDRILTLEYFSKYSFVADWQFLFLVGIFLGALLSATLNGTFFIEGIPELWRDKFGSNLWPRLTMAFFGGILAAFGARMADGCPSGHGLSGLMQLSVSGVVSLVAFFIGGMAMAKIIYGRS